MALRLHPRTSVSAGHSVYGGEADVVLSRPDLSAFRQWAVLRKDCDEIIRLVYVVMTRVPARRGVLRSSGTCAHADCSPGRKAAR
jgi:hypothetical protein